MSEHEGLTSEEREPNACDDPRCQIPEHRASRTAGWLTETERLILRNVLLANQDMGLTAAEATAVAYVAKPAVEAIVAARLADAEARAEALRSALERTQANFIAAVNGKPVRDMAENLAENREALRGDQ